MANLIQNGNLISYTVFRSNSLGAYENEVLKDNPVAYWKMSEKSGTQAVDINNTFHGTYASVGLGHAGRNQNPSARSVYYSGSASMSLGLVSSATDNMSGEGWFWWDGTSNSNQWGFSVGSGNGWGFYPHDTFDVPSGTSLSTSYIQLASILNLSITAKLPVKQWAHVAVVRAAGVFLFYMNGISYPVANNTVSLSAPTASTNVGSNSSLADNFRGFISDVAFYETPLSRDRILAHYLVGVNTIPQSGVLNAAGGLPFSFRFPMINNMRTFNRGIF